MDNDEFSEDYIRGVVSKTTTLADVTQERICPGCGYHSNHSTSDLYCSERKQIILAFEWKCSECDFSGVMAFDIYH